MFHVKIIWMLLKKKTLLNHWPCTTANMNKLQKLRKTEMEHLGNMWGSKFHNYCHNCLIQILRFNLCIKHIMTLDSIISKQKHHIRVGFVHIRFPLNFNYNNFHVVIIFKIKYLFFLTIHGLFFAHNQGLGTSDLTSSGTKTQHHLLQARLSHFPLLFMIYGDHKNHPSLSAELSCRTILNNLLYLCRRRCFRAKIMASHVNFWASPSHTNNTGGKSENITYENMVHFSVSERRPRKKTQEHKWEKGGKERVRHRGAHTSSCWK